MTNLFDRLPSRPPLREAVVDALHEAILTGRILPGDRIPEQELAQQLGVSRVPIREAIRILEQQGLLETRPKRGTYVVELSLTELEEGFRIRAALEKLAVEEALQRLNDQGWQELCDRLEEYVVGMRQAMEHEVGGLFARFDLDLHTALIDASGNSQLSQTWRRLGLPLRFNALTRRFGLPTKEERALSLRSHEELIEVLRRRDPIECQQKVGEHALGQLVLQSVRQGGSTPQITENEPLHTSQSPLGRHKER